MSFFFSWQILPFIQSIQSRTVFSKIAPQNTSPDRWSPKSRILTPISFGNNAKCIEFDKSSLYVRVCVCVCVCVCKTYPMKWAFHKPYFEKQASEESQLVSKTTMGSSNPNWFSSPWVYNKISFPLHLGFYSSFVCAGNLCHLQTKCNKFSLHSFFAWKPCIERAGSREPGSLSTSLEQAPSPHPNLQRRVQCVGKINLCWVNLRLS